MSMIGNFSTISDTTLAELLDDPEKLPPLLYDGQPWPRPDDGIQLDIDKAWHGLHYLLTGQVWEGVEPLNFILAGQPVGDIDVGYGPARALTSDQVRTLADALQPITRETLASRFDPAAMSAQEIYPNIWNRAPGDDDDPLAYLLDYFDQLKSFILTAADKRTGLLIWLN